MKEGVGATAADDTGRDAGRGPLSYLSAVAVTIALLAAGEQAYLRSPLPAAIRPSDAYLTKIADYTKKGGADVVIVGSSRVFHGANSPLLTRMASEATGERVRVYNLGVPAGDLPGYVLTIEDVLRPGLKRPKLFVFGMSPIEWTCCPATSVPSSAKWVAAVRPRHAWALFTSASDPEEAFTDLTIGLSQAYGARTHILTRVLRGKDPQAWADPGQDGWVSYGWPVDPRTQEARAQMRTDSYRPNFYPPKHFDREGTAHYLARALARLEAAGVKVAFFGTPQARQLDRNNDAGGFYPEYVAYLTEVARAHGTEFVNLNDFPGLVNGDFADGDHLVEPGSVKFSRVLAERVIIPALKGERPRPL